MNITLKKLNKKLIAVTIGDIEGIGIQLLLKEWKNRKIYNFILITNLDIFNKFINLNNKNINIINKKTQDKYDKNKLNILNIKTKNKYTNTIDSLNLAYKYTKEKIFIGILTLPLNKNKINKYVNHKFIDQTSFFSKKEKAKNTNMIFIHRNKFFIPLTIHIELKNVYKFFKNKNLVINKVESLIYTLKHDFNISNPKLILAGINPHAGENNLISDDENKYLKPIIKILKKKKINITGPVSGDSIINNFNLINYDAFIFTFHDQALIPFKIISKYKGVNFTSKLDIIRTSPSHGTAESLIGSKKTTSEGILNSFKLIKKISYNRNKS